MAKKKKNVEEEFGPLLDAVKNYVVKTAVEDAVGSIALEEDRKAVQTVLYHMRRCVIAFFELRRYIRTWTLRW